MPRLLGLYQWNDIVGKRFPHLSKPMAACLALWSLGMIVARSCSLTAVAWAWVPILKEKFYTLRERLRDLYREGPAKAGDKRAELDLGTCWAPWLSWVVEGWHSKQLALALDATTLGQRFTVLAVSVLYRGCAVPVAWKILKANEPHAWAPEWKTMLSHFRQRVPADWNVIVLADPWLVLTDLPPEAAEVCWYGLRAWIEQGFKRIKRGGWQWQYTRMNDPARAERLWLAVAIATWWLLSVGGEADAQLPVETMDEVPHTQRSRRPRWRLIAIFHRGWTQILAALLHHSRLPLGEGWPEPWPQMIPPPTESPATDASKPKNLQL